MKRELTPESYQLLIEAMPIAVVLVNTTGVICYLNKHTEELFQYKKNELIGRDWTILLPKNSIEVV